jgi:hypothetical protein
VKAPIASARDLDRDDDGEAGTAASFGWKGTTVEPQGLRRRQPAGDSGDDVHELTSSSGRCVSS